MGYAAPALRTSAPAVPPIMGGLATPPALPPVSLPPAHPTANLSPPTPAAVAPTPSYSFTGPNQEYNATKNPFVTGGAGFLRRRRKNAPSWLQSDAPFNQGLANVQEILASKGRVNPAVLYRMQADAETGRQNAHDSILNNAAMNGWAPDDPRVMSELSAASGAADRARAEAGRNYDIMAEERMRSDIAQLYPFISALLQVTGKSSGGLTVGPAAPSYHPDYAGAAASIIGDVGSSIADSRR